MNILRSPSIITFSIRKLTLKNNKNINVASKHERSLQRVFKRNFSQLYGNSNKKLVRVVIFFSAMGALYYYYQYYILPNSSINLNLSMEDVIKMLSLPNKPKDISAQKQETVNESYLDTKDFIIPSSLLVEPDTPNIAFQESNLSNIDEKDNVETPLPIVLESIQESEESNKPMESGNFDESVLETGINNLLVKIGQTITNLNNINSKISIFINEEITDSLDLTEVNINNIAIKIDKEWVELSLMSQKYEEELKNYMNELGEFEKQIFDNKELISNNVINLFDECKLQINDINNQKYKIISQFNETINDIKDINSNNIYYEKIFNSLKNENMDINFIIYYLLFKIKKLESYHHSKLIDIINLLYEKYNENLLIKNNIQNQEYEKLIKEYENKIRDFDDNKEIMLRESLKNDILDFTKNYTSHQIYEILESLENQKQDIKSTYKIDSELLESNLRSKILINIEPIFSKLLSIQGSMALINETFNTLSKHSILLQTVYSIRFVLDQEHENGLTLPLNPYIVSLLNNKIQDDQLIDQIVPLIPNQAIQRGIYTKSNLLRRLENIKKQCERSVFIAEQKPTPLLRVISFIHSVFRLKDNRDIDILHDSPSSPSLYEDIYYSYAVLDSVSKSIEKGDITECIRKMSLLKGYPRELAQEWINDATEHVITNNTVNFLMISLNNRIIDANKD